MSRLRVILDGLRTGAVNMQRDEDLLRGRQPGDDPVLRLYRWRPYAVSIGYNQRSDDFDPAAVAELGFDIVRRPTGGRAILHAEELTYCVVGDAPSPLFGDSLHSTYMRINEALVAFLAALGHEAEISGGESRHEMGGAVCFKSAGQHEIRVDGLKLVGSAQRRLSVGFLQHGSILTGPAHLALLDCLIPERRTLDRRQLAGLTTDLGRLQGRPFTTADAERCEAVLAETFAGVFGLEAVPEVWD